MQTHFLLEGESGYLTFMDYAREHGFVRGDRTGTGTISVFGGQIRHDLRHSFPLFTTKTVNLRAIVAELAWFIRGDTNLTFLHDRGVGIWDEWADANGDLGPIYGHQWRSWMTTSGESVDQLAQVIEQLKSNPESRRHIVSAWNVADLPRMKLAPCHCLFQFFVADGRLSCQLYQRSCDLFLGGQFNAPSYALLTHLIARECGLEIGDFIHTFGDAHVYSNHVDQVREQVGREVGAAPRLVVSDSLSSIFELDVEHVSVEGYDPAPWIPAPVAV